MNDLDISVDIFLSKSQIFSVLVSTSHHTHDYVMKWGSVYVNLVTVLIARDHNADMMHQRRQEGSDCCKFSSVFVFNKRVFTQAIFFKTSLFVICFFINKFKEFTEAGWQVN